MLTVNVKWSDYGPLNCTHLHNLYVWQAVQEGLQIDAVEHNAIVKDVSIGLEVNHCLFLLDKTKKNVENMNECLILPCLCLGRF